jgi:hypothetical protein
VRRCLCLAALLLTWGVPLQAAAEERRLLWGDTHLHTSYSFDAFLNGNMSADPDVAYRYAKGLPVIHPYHRTRVRIDTPLDFLVVSDHAEFLGGIRDIYYDGIQDQGPQHHRAADLPLQRVAHPPCHRQRQRGADFFRDLLPSPVIHVKPPMTLGEQGDTAPCRARTCRRAMPGSASSKPRTPTTTPGASRP